MADERLPWSGCRLCSLSAKDTRWNRDSAVPESALGRIETTCCAVEAEGHSNAEVEWSEHPSSSFRFPELNQPI